MRLLAPLLFVALALAGCTASGQDPWEYTKKPLYAGGFDLADLSGTSETQEFRVTDGSIGAIRLLVWVNATAGAANVRISNPSGHEVLSTSEFAERQYGLELGAWVVNVSAEENSAGVVHILAVRG